MVLIFIKNSPTSFRVVRGNRNTKKEISLNGYMHIFLHKHRFLSKQKALVERLLHHFLPFSVKLFYYLTFVEERKRKMLTVIDLKHVCRLGDRFSTWTAVDRARCSATTPSPPPTSSRLNTPSLPSFKSRWAFKEYVTHRRQYKNQRIILKNLKANRGSYL